MRTRLTLYPDQCRAKQLLAQYGNRLVCVRYRYDEQRKRRFKTAEVIVEERVGTPPLSAISRKPGARPGGMARRRGAATGEACWGEMASAAWGVGLRYDLVVALGLEERIVGDEESI